MLMPMIVAMLPALSSVPPPLPLKAAVKGELSAVGADPVWSLDIGPDGIKLTEADQNDGVEQDYPAARAMADPDGYSIISGPLLIVLKPEACSDGKGGTDYPYSITVAIADEVGRTLKGCAYRPWGQDVVAAMPVIDLCLAQTKDRPAIVYAAAAGAADGYVVMPGADEKPLEACTVSAGVAAIAPADMSALPPGTNAEIFIRGPGENPGGECYDAAEVKDAAGAVLGWWLDPEGC